MPYKIKTVAPVTVASAGTRQRLSGVALKTRMIIVQADPDNAGRVFMGDSTVSSSNGLVLEAGDFYSYAVPEIEHFFEVDLHDLFVDAASSGDKVRVSYLEDA